ncbi:hypothetical protein RQ684_29120, partial [Pseudomonas aeruginosa]
LHGGGETAEAEEQGGESTQGEAREGGHGLLVSVAFLMRINRGHEHYTKRRRLYLTPQRKKILRREKFLRQTERGRLQRITTRRPNRICWR